MHFIILKLNLHEIKLNLHSKIANFNYKVQNCKLHQNEIFDVLSLFWNRTTVAICIWPAVGQIAFETFFAICPASGQIAYTSGKCYLSGYL